MGCPVPSAVPAAAPELLDAAGAGALSIALGVPWGGALCVGAVALGVDVTTQSPLDAELPGAQFVLAGLLAMGTEPLPDAPVLLDDVACRPVSGSDEFVEHAPLTSAAPINPNLRSVTRYL
jgi:hypothetical protein